MDNKSYNQSRGSKYRNDLIKKATKHELIFKSALEISYIDGNDFVTLK